MAMFSRRLRVEILEGRRLLAGVLEIADMEACREHETIDTAPASVAVLADNLEGLRAAEMRFTYDSKEFDVDSDSIKAGAAWQNKASVVSKVDQAAGTIDVFVFSANPITSSEGQLLEVEFDVVDQLARDVSTHIELTKFELNEGAITSLPALEYQSKSEPVHQLLRSEPAQLNQQQDFVRQPRDRPADIANRSQQSSRVQPRELATPIVGPEHVQISVQPTYGYFHSDADWQTVESRQKLRRA